MAGTADRRFLLPGLSVSLLIGGLCTHLAAAPAAVMSELGLSAFELGVNIASMVVIVFAAGFLAPRPARRWGPRAVGMIGLVIAIAGALSMFAFAAAPALITFTAAIGLYLLGIGPINPLGTAITLQPFGRQAGLASALLGFLQVGCAAVGASLASVLLLPPHVSFAVLLTAGSALALPVFLPVVLHRSPAAPMGSGSVSRLPGQ